MIKLYGALLGGILLFLSLFYWRFLRERPAGALNLDYSNSTLFLYIVSICFMLLTLYSMLISSQSIENIDKKNYVYCIIKKFITLKQKLSILYNEFIKDFYDFILYKISSYIKFMHYITPIWYSMHTYFYFFIHVFIFLPPCLVSLAFFIDIVILKSFTFFPKSIFFLLVPLLLKAIAYSVKELLETDLGTVQRNIYFDPGAPDGEKYYIRKELWNIKPELAYILHTKLNYFLSEYEKNLKFMEKSEEFENYMIKKYPKLYYQLVSSILWIISWICLIMYMVQKL